MTVFCSHRLDELAGIGRSPMASSSRLTYAERLGVQVRRAVNGTVAAFGPGDDWTLQPAGRGNRDLDSDAARFPQRPLILGDKWDF